MEMRALDKIQSWEIVELPKRKKSVGWEWIFNIKHKTDGALERYKARLVAKGSKYMTLITWRLLL